MNENALINETSPYLQQHAHNPVNWHPWSKEVLQKAKKENKLLIISIGYAACHWCHVMERESFSDVSVARFMNEHFISIKVDREERPDIDQIYMKASQLVTGNGGWPLNAFALPDGKPFYTVTYLPQSQWLDFLHQIVTIHQKEPERLTKQAEMLTQGIEGQQLLREESDTGKEAMKQLYNQLFDLIQRSIDFKNGGLGRAPKFPMPTAWELLLQYYYFTHSEEALKAITLTLDQMAMGGICDQLGGGFARYATDTHWRIPHFEKMLYDNGQLVSLYSHAYQVTHKPLYAEVVRKTLYFIQKELTTPDGNGFYSSINADSEGEEGKFYVWSADEIHELLSAEDADLISLVKEYYNITPEGNWEPDKNILYRNTGDASFAKKHGLTLDKLKAALHKAREILLRARSTRVRPTTDDKILTSWNAIMLKGFIHAYSALGDKNYLTSALKNARFLERNGMENDGSLLRSFSYKEGKNTKTNKRIPGLLDDYAFLAEAYIALYQVTFDLHWLTLASQLADFALEHFYDTKSGLFYYTSDGPSELIARQTETEDNVIPSSNSVMAHVLYRLGLYYDDPKYISLSEKMLHLIAGQISSAVPYFANWAMLLGLMVSGVYEIAIVGENALAKNYEMQKVYLPNSLFIGGNLENLPLLKNKRVPGDTVIYVCKDKLCKLPVATTGLALNQIK